MNLRTVNGHPSVDDLIKPKAIDDKRIGTRPRGYGRWGQVFRVTKLKDGIPHGERDLGALIVKVLFIACLCMGSGAAYPRALGSDAADVPALQVGLEHGFLSIAAQRVPWQRVLDQITNMTGIRFRSGTPLAGSVTVSIEPLPFRQALEHLLGPGADFICRYVRATDSGATPI